MGNQRLDHLLSKEFREEIPEGETHTDVQCVPRPFRTIRFKRDQGLKHVGYAGVLLIYLQKVNLTTCAGLKEKV